VVNAGIGGNQVAGPANYAQNPVNGGEAAVDRVERDVISLPGVSTVLWLEGINDFGMVQADVNTVENGVRTVVAKLRHGIPGVRIIMATVTSSKNSTIAGYGTPDVEAKRQAYNQFIRTSGLFDSIVDFDAVTVDPTTGELKVQFQPNTSIGGAGDKLHPNRVGYQAMGNAVDLGAVTNGGR
jgi:lysophospholipase L1-like esterase